MLLRSRSEAPDDGKMFAFPNKVEIDGVLSRRLGEILPSGVVGAVRRIRMEDDQLLSPAEAAGMGRAVVARRRESGAARMLARSLLGSMSKPHPDIFRSSRGAPIWPAGVVGSLAHDKVVAAAMVGPGAAFGGLGVDVEPAEPLDDELISIVATPIERRTFGRHPLHGKVLFCVKEAVFKAVNPFDRRFLAFGDIVVDHVSGLARTSYGRVVRWRAVAEPRILVVAWW